MRLLKNKKGIEFLPLLMFFLLPFLVYLSYVILEQSNQNIYTIGEIAQEMIQTFDLAEKDQLYFEAATKQSLKNNIKKISETGGNPFELCGTYMGYALMNNKDSKCFNAKQIANTLISGIEGDVRASLTNINYVIDYQYTIASENPLELDANSQYIDIPILMRTSSAQINARYQNNQQTNQNSNANSGGFSYQWPLEITANDVGTLGSHNRITSCLGARNRCSACTESHQGLDISGNYGDFIYSIIDGTVTHDIGPDYNTIYIKDSTGKTVKYLHNSVTYVVKGDTVRKGQKIALVGGKGPTGLNEYPNHLHLEFRDSNDNVIDPFDIQNKIYDITTLGLKFDDDSNCVYMNQQYAWQGADYMVTNQIG